MHKQLEVQDFLRTRTFGELAKEWGVYARCDRLAYKVSLNYDMLEYTPGHRPTEQCRGLVLALDRDNDLHIPNKNGKVDEDFCPGPTVVLAYPFDKFYNEQECHAAKLDWSSGVAVQDKMDGTLCILYYDTVKCDWCVATRSVPDADMPLDGWPDSSFRKLFESGVLATFGLSMKEWVKGLDMSMTYMFELTSPYNRIFVSYKETKVTLLGIRDNLTGLECDPDQWLTSQGLQMPRPKHWELGSVEEIQRFVNSISPDECEGAVVLDSKHRRIKIKNVNWVTANATKTSLGTSPRNLMRYVLSGISDDITAMLPDDLRERLFAMRDGIQRLFKETDTNFATWKEEAGGDRKRFAELVNISSTTWTAPCFKLYEGKFSSTSEFVKDIVARDKLGDGFLDTLIENVKGK